MYRPIKVSLNSKNKIEIEKDTYQEGLSINKMVSISVNIIERNDVEFFSREDVENLIQHARHTLISFYNRNAGERSVVIVLEDIPFSLLAIKDTDEFAIIETISVGRAVNDNSIEVTGVERRNSGNENVYYHNKGYELVVGFKVVDRDTANLNNIPNLSVDKKILN